MTSTYPRLNNKNIAHIDGNTAILAPLLSEINDYKVRYTVRIDGSYPRQSHYMVEVFSPATMSWNELWTLAPTEFRCVEGPQSDVEFDPETYVITKPISKDRGRQVTSWQKIIDALREMAAEILA